LELQPAQRSTGAFCYSSTTKQRGVELGTNSESPYRDEHFAPQNAKNGTLVTKIFDEQEIRKIGQKRQMDSSWRQPTSATEHQKIMVRTDSERESNKEQNQGFKSGIQKEENDSDRNEQSDQSTSTRAHARKSRGAHLNDSASELHMVLIDSDSERADGDEAYALSDSSESDSEPELYADEVDCAFPAVDVPIARDGLAVEDFEFPSREQFAAAQQRDADLAKGENGFYSRNGLRKMS